MKPFVLVAAAAMALASCQKNEMPAPEKQTVHFTVNAGIETKTSIVEGKDAEENIIYTPQWDGNEELGLLFAAPNENTKAEHVITLTNEVSGSTASFQGEVENVEPTGTFYAFYPAEAFSRGYTEGDARLDLKNVQKPTATSFDPKCDILVAKPYDYSVEEGSVVANGLQFARIMSVLRIDLKSEFADVQNEFVESISFTAGDVNIAGYARIFLDNPDFTGKWASSGSQWCTVTANYDSDLVSINGASNSVYLVIAPVTIPANKDLTFEIKTKNYNISKTVTSPKMNFTAGNVSKINLTIEEANCEKIDQSIDYSGEYLIVNKDLTKAASKWGDGNNLPAVDLQTANGVVNETDNIADCKMTITKVTEGDNAGKYTIQDAAGKYLYAAGGTEKNYLKGQDTASYWTIEEKDGNFEITSTVANCTRNILRYNSQSNLFSCYASGQNDVTLYKYSDIKVDTTPKISVTNKSYSALATDTSVEIPYTVKNITGAITATVAGGTTMSNVSANVTADKVTVSFAANEESAEKSATIVLSYEGAESVSVVITQEGKASEIVKEETVIYQTAFNYPINGSAYNSATEYVGTDDAGTSWGIKYGNWNGNNCAQLRVYSAGNFGSVYMKFDVANATRVTYKAKVSNTALNLNTYYSTDSGSTWTKVNTSKALTTSLASYEFNISATGEYSKVRIKFEAAGTAPSSNNYQLTIDDVVIYGFENGGGETPEPDEPETPVDPTPDPDEPETPEQGESFTATFNFKQIYVDNGNAATSNVTIGAVTFIGEKGTGTTPARAWSDGLRLYAGSKVTFKAAEGYVITNISGHNTFAFTGSQQNVEFTGLAKATIADNIVVTYKKN